MGAVRVLGGVKEECAVGYGEFACLMKKGSERDVVFEVRLPEEIAAPVSQGDAIGKVIYRLGDEVIGECDITARETVEKISFWGLLARMARLILLHP